MNLQPLISVGNIVEKILVLESVPPKLQIHFSDREIRTVELSPDMARGILRDETQTIEQLVKFGYSYTQAKNVIAVAKDIIDWSK